ncbi:MAG TPA: hypothetical protein GXX51_05180 [Firmicutes bacterium]|nr:hypothetical protein [Bacillota bacterium]
MNKNMNREIECLFNLQRLDKRRAELEHKLRSLPVAAEVREIAGTISRDEAVIREMVGELAAMKKGQKEKEWELAEITKNQAAIQKKLYGGEVTNPREIGGLEVKLNNIEICKRKLEDDLVGLMERIEATEETLKQKTEMLAEKRRLLESLESDLRGQEGEIRDELAALAVQREAVASEVTGGLLAIYEQLLRSKGGLAVAGVRGDICGGCHVALPTFVIMQLKAGGRVVRCENCGRILFRQRA